MSQFANATWLSQPTSSISEKQQQANRANAQQSTGPKTDEGKTVSRMNAERHGLYTQRTHWKGQNRQQFNDMVADLFKEFKPQTDHEESLLCQWAELRCRLERCKALYWDLSEGYDRKREELEADMGLDDDATFQLGLRMIHSLDKLTRLENRLKRQLAQLEEELGTLLNRYESTLTEPNGFVSPPEKENQGIAPPLPSPNGMNLEPNAIKSS